MLETLNRVRRSVPTPIRRRFKNVAYRIAARKYYRENKYLGGERKILYALTPPSTLTNIGDHAQAIAIHKWLKEHWGSLPVLEADKIESQHFLPELKKLITPVDIIFLHSGGNLSDRAQWSESVRRELIEAFPENHIVSLPQTIFFSATEEGDYEKKKSSEIYSKHRRLAITARDSTSYELAKEMFQNSELFAVPDFVLSMDQLTPKKVTEQSPLFLLREDGESAFGARRAKIIEEIGMYGHLYDTETEGDIPRGRRREEFEGLLAHIMKYPVVVTDRYHGLIFSFLCRKPTVVLPTVDHKLTSVAHWFERYPTISFAKSIEDVPKLLTETQNRTAVSGTWNQDFFDPYAEQIKSWIGRQ